METAILKTLGRRIRERRRSVGLSQEELGHRAGIDRSYISGLERGLRNPTFQVLNQIAGALACTVAALLPDGEARDAAGSPGDGFQETPWREPQPG